MSATIYVKKKDESTLEFNSEDKGVLFEMDSYFTFYSPNYRFDPRYKRHIWDGKIHLLKMKKLEAPLGLRERIKHFCAERKYEFVDLTESERNQLDTDTSKIDEFITSLKLPYEVRDYQREALIHAIENPKCVMTSPTGSGKSLIQYMIMRWYYRQSQKIVMIVPSTSLVEQMIQDFTEYSANDASFNTSEIVRPLYAGKNTDPYETDIVVSTWQSLQNFDKALYETWDVILNDEAHQAAAKVLAKINGGATNARVKIGMTGSLHEDLLNEYTLIGLFGEIYTVTTTSALQANGSLSPLNVYMLTLKHNSEVVKKYYNDHEQNPTYIDEVNFLNNREKRNLYIRNLICACKGTTMILFNRVEHGKLLYTMLKEKLSGREVFHIDGEVSAEERERIRVAVKSSEGAILCASIQTSATGINIPSIENIIIFPSKSRVRNLQSIGRGLRVKEGKKYCNCFVISDDFSLYRRRKSYSIKHSIEQYRIFQQENFNVVFKTIENF